MIEKITRWLAGEWDPLDHVLDVYERPDADRTAVKAQKKQLREDIDRRDRTGRVVRAEQRGYYVIYNVTAVISCVLLIGVLLYTVANLPEYGTENPRTVEVVSRYIEKGLEETGAVNIVAGMILDYRAFDTLGESHVLFTALICVMILLHKDRKNMRSTYEDYYTILNEPFFDLSKDAVLASVGKILLPCIFLFGIYILLNGQNSPGGGFSGGSILGTALIILASGYGFSRTDRFLTRRMLMIVTFCSLSFYSFAKGYVFFTGANGLENHIPKGTPGAILSGGLILPLDIAVGMVVACTMYGFYSLFKRGSIGDDGKSLDQQ